MAAHPIIDAYFGGMRARNIDALVGLFAQKSVMILPDGRELAGLAAVRSMYTHLFAASPPTPTPANAVVGEGVVAVEIEARLDDGSVRRTANFFEIDSAGKIQRLSIYKRG